ncbi:hypothetical protein XA68_16560 [Ophiocordyceps unilateralis]|uniref:Uncharacterized protein n=1 Tax=Ophiocordyceps unilateralis TaxID=268505 RepID=A0A2A9P4N5_OPHUN|nr:hypothetical protein XA68_16560 [Ophiocordyceps unilateralis]
MAFQQSARQPLQRVARPATVDDHEHSDARVRLSPERHQASGSWVLFSPPTDATTTSYLSETDRSLPTPGRSQLSDLGSLNTVARSSQPSNASQQLIDPVADDASVEDDAELDSLDSHLPGFRSLPGAHASSPVESQKAQPVLPSHDGLGSFRLPDQPVLGRDAQDHIYQFERFNPRRVRRRLDSFNRGQLDLEHGQRSEEEVRLRIEAWRLEHSRTLLDEVQRETRRRLKSHASMQRFHRPTETDTDGMSWHDEDHVQPEQGDEGLLVRITRKVLKDLLGLDDRLLALLLGDTLPPEVGAVLTGDQLSSTKAQESVRQLRLMETLSRELGVVIHQLSHHPGAFSTFARVQQMPLPYAGLPVIPESGDVPQAAQLSDVERSSRHPSAVDFQPTMPRQPRAAGDLSGLAQTEDEAGDECKMDSTFTQDEWERDLDANLVFRYVLSRFSGRSKKTSAASSCHTGASTAQDSAAKMTRVRQHHPLIGRTRPVERRAFKATMPASPATLRHHSSCASQSTRRSARRSSCSSRHYWDVGGSSHGGMGSWGEV